MNYFDSFDNEENGMMELIQTVAPYEFSRKIQDIEINYEFLIKSVDENGKYHRRLNFTLILLLFSATLQILQIILLFDPKVDDCRKIHHKNILLTNPRFQNFIQEVVDPCKSKCVPAISNPLIDFQLECHFKYFKEILQGTYAVIFIIGIYIALHLSMQKKKVITISLFVVSFQIIIYSWNMQKQEQQQQITQLSQNLQSLDNFYELYIFIGAYLSSAFFLAIGLVSQILFVLEHQTQFQKSNFGLQNKMIIIMSILIGSLLKMIVTNWRIYNIVFCAIPFFIIGIFSSILFKESPKELINQYKQSREREQHFVYQIESLSQLELDSKLKQLKAKVEQDLQIIHQTFSDIHQLNHNEMYFQYYQFKILFENLKDQNIFQPKTFSTKYMFILFIFTYLYISQFLHMYYIGQTLEFNIFCISLSEILGQIMVVRFFEHMNQPKLLKQIFILYGIITLFFSMPLYDIKQAHNFQKVSVLVCICIMRISFGLTLQILMNKIDNMAIYIWSILLGFTIPLLSKNLLISGIFCFVGAWLYK